MWKYDEVKEAVDQKKVAFKAYSICNSNNIEEKDRLKEEYKLKKKIAAKAVAKAKATEGASLYEELETKEGQHKIFKIAAQRRYNSCPMPTPKYINDKEGNLLTCDSDICARFKEYFSDLLNQEFPSNVSHEIDPVLTEIEDFSDEEVSEAVKQMKNGKAVGPDQIPAELWKKCGDIGITFLAILFNKIKQGDKMPEAFRNSFLLPFFKNKGDSRDCGNYRAIKLIPHSEKIWEHVICNRIWLIVLLKIVDNQCGFVPNRSTMDAIQALRILTEKYRDAKLDLHIIFVDFEKAFDRVPRSLIWLALRYHEVPEAYIKIIQNMYENVVTQIRCNAGYTEPFEVKVGVHQGSVLSPLLFILVLNYLMRGRWNRTLAILAFADDLALVDDDLIRLQEALNELQQILEGSGMRISRTKTEYLYCPFKDPGAPTPDMMLDLTIIPKCNSFKYLGSIVTAQGSCTEDVNHRVTVGWLKWRENSLMFCDKRMPSKLKGRLHTTVLRPALTYGSKSWTFYKEYLQKLNTAEMKMLRMASGVTKLDKIRNEHIRGSLQIKQSIQDKVEAERVAWFERVHQQHPEHVAKKALNIKINPTVTQRGRKKNSWERQMKEHQSKYGLTEAEKQQHLEYRSRLRSNANPGNLAL